MKKIVLSLSLAIMASGAAFISQPAFADTYTYKHVEEGPAQVLDSWMQPTVVRSRAIKETDGTTTTVEEPLVLERHERVVVPSTETTTTTNVISQPTVVHRETTRQVAYSSTAKRSAPRKRYHHVAHRAKPHAVAHRAPARRSYVASKVVEERVERPAVVEQTESTVQKETVIERRHPALDLY